MIPPPTATGTKKPISLTSKFFAWDKAIQNPMYIKVQGSHEKYWPFFDNIEELDNFMSNLYDPSTYIIKKVENHYKFICETYEANPNKKMGEVLIYNPRITETGRLRWFELGTLEYMVQDLLMFKWLLLVVCLSAGGTASVAIYILESGDSEFTESVETFKPSKIYSIEELQSKKDLLTNGQSFQVRGVTRFIQREKGTVYFFISHQAELISVIYKGKVPKSFDDLKKVIVEGHWDYHDKDNPSVATHELDDPYIKAKSVKMVKATVGATR